MLVKVFARVSWIVKQTLHKRKKAHSTCKKGLWLETSVSQKQLTVDENE